MRRVLLATLVVMAAVAAFFGWWYREVARPPQAAAPTAAEADAPPALAAAEAGGIHGLRVEVTAVSRPAADVVEIRLTLINRHPAAPLVVGDRFAEGPAESGTLSGAFLATSAGRARYYVLRDDSGAPACSTGLQQLGPGERREAWVRFASPGTTGAVTLQLKGFPALGGLTLPEASPDPGED